jgi:hypothetical protein
MATDKTWRFRATVTKDVRMVGPESGGKKGDVFYPKGFYYSGPKDEWIILVGDVVSGNTIRARMPRACLKMEVRDCDEAW